MGLFRGHCSQEAEANVPPDALAVTFAKSCARAATVAGLNRRRIEKEVGDLSAYMHAQLESLACEEAAASRRSETERRQTLRTHKGLRRKSPGRLLRRI
jgi:hypothetical protein